MENKSFLEPDIYEVIATDYDKNYEKNLTDSLHKVIGEGKSLNMDESDIILRRSRGIRQMVELFRPGAIIDDIHQLIDKGPKVNLLEIGMGEGRCLLELGKIFGEKLGLWGLNLKPEGGVLEREDLFRNAENFGLDINGLSLPNIIFGDAGVKIPGDDSFFDIVISQVTFLYIEDKAKAIEEVWRILKPGGTAFIHFDGNLGKHDDISKYPSFLKANQETPRFQIRQGGEIVYLSAYLKNNFPKLDIFIKKHSSASLRTLIIKKNKDIKLDLGLDYDAEASIRLYDTPEKREARMDNMHTWNGVMSVFKIRQNGKQ